VTKTSVKALRRSEKLKKLVFPGFEGMAIPNILTLKPENG